jgi:uncharacterized LabA/DUF88 family protein
MSLSNFKMAVLIDGDNAESELIDHILNEVAKFGKVTIKRIYADWTLPQMNKWKAQLNKYAIRPIQKFSYTTGKNSTDTALIIDVMDIMHHKLADGFCIVSSDSDYTGIAHRIREEGLFVMGIGKSHTPEAFVKACESFTYTEILHPVKERSPRGKGSTAVGKRQPAEKQVATPVPKAKEPTQLTQLTNKITKKPIDLELVNNAYDMAVDSLKGQALASSLGVALKKIDPTFDIRNYGFSSLRKFMEALQPQYKTIIHEDKTTISLKKSDR